MANRLELEEPLEMDNDELVDDLINFIEENGLIVGTWQWADHARDDLTEFVQSWFENA